MFNEFKDFAMKGNMLDMAVGIVMGGAFGTIIKSLVDDIIMPPVGMLMGGVDFSEMKLILKDGTGDVAPVSMNYGLFINPMIAFIIIALALFFVIKGVNSAKKAEEEAPAEPPRSEVLLEEILVALKR